MLLRCNRAVREGKAAWRPCEAAGTKVSGAAVSALWVCAAWDFSWERLVSAPLGFRKIQGAFLAVRPGERLFSKQAGGPVLFLRKGNRQKGGEEGKTNAMKRGTGRKRKNTV